MEAPDADLVADMHVRSQRAAYRAFMPAAYLDSPEREVEARAKWQQRLATSVAGAEGWVTMADGAPAGFAYVKPAEPEGVEPVPAGLGYLPNIHLLPEHVGGGSGRPLFAQALGSMAAAGYTEGALWVYELNERARGFYEAMGWSHDGTGAERRVEWEGPAFTVVGLRYRGPTAPR